MKTKFTFLLIIALGVTHFMQAQTVGDKFKVGQLYYEITQLTPNKEVAVVPQKTNSWDDSEKPTGDVVIPATVNYNGAGYSVTSIEKFAFYECEDITTIEIGSNVAFVGSRAFETRYWFTNNPKLTAITVAAGNSAFTAQDGVLFNTDVTRMIWYPQGKSDLIYSVPASITHMQYSCFKDVNAITQVNLPEGLLEIGSDDSENVGYALYGCPHLTEVNLPASLTAIYSYSFFGIKVSSLHFPEGITSLSSISANNTELTEVTFPSTLTRLRWYSFAGCPKLTTVNAKMVVPPNIEGEEVFNNTNISAATLNVPVGSKAAYEAADTWKDFGTINEVVFTNLPQLQESNFQAWGGKGVIYVELPTSAINQDLGAVKVEIYTTQGQLVYSSLLSTAGTHTLTPTLENWGSGVYIVNVGTAAQKVVVR